MGKCFSKCISDCLHDTLNLTHEPSREEFDLTPKIIVDFNDISQQSIDRKRVGSTVDL